MGEGGAAIASPGVRRSAIARPSASVLAWILVEVAPADEDKQGDVREHGRIANTPAAMKALVKNPLRTAVV